MLSAFTLRMVAACCALSIVLLLTLQSYYKPKRYFPVSAG